jgi:hypothetical protein
LLPVKDRSNFMGFHYHTGVIPAKHIPRSTALSDGSAAITVVLNVSLFSTWLPRLAARREKSKAKRLIYISIFTLSPI